MVVFVAAVALVISAVSGQLFAAPQCKGDTVDLQRSRGGLRTLAGVVCDRLEGAQGGPLHDC